MTKQCGKCKETKPLDAFNKDQSKPMGLDRICRACKAEKNRTYRHTPYGRSAQRRSERHQDKKHQCWIKEVKTATGCQLCGEAEPVCLHFHHIDPSNKKVGLSYAAIKLSGKRRIKEEMRKCAVLCANCHAKWHHGKLGDIELVPLEIE